MRLKAIILGLLIALGACGGRRPQPVYNYQPFTITFVNKTHYDVKGRVVVEPGAIRAETNLIPAGQTDYLNSNFIPQKITMWVHADGGAPLYGPIYGYSPPYDSPFVFLYYGTDFTVTSAGVTITFR